MLLGMSKGVQVAFQQRNAARERFNQAPRLEDYEIFLDPPIVREFRALREELALTRYARICAERRATGDARADAYSLDLTLVAGQLLRAAAEQSTGPERPPEFLQPRQSPQPVLIVTTLTAPHGPDFDTCATLVRVGDLAA
jgi:hypothetical protein